MTYRFVFSGLLLSIVSAFAAPSVTTLTPNDGATIGSFTSLSVTFSEPVTGVDANDLSVNSDSALGVSGSGAGPYVFTFTQPLAGTVSVSWEPDHGIAGLGTGAFAPPGGYSFTLADTIAPTVGKIRTSQTSDGTLDDVVPTPGATVGSLSSVVVAFSENVSGVDATDLLIGGVAASSISGTGPYTFTFASQPAGTVNFSWAAGHGIVDGAGNAFAGGGWSVTVSATPGGVTVNEFLAANGIGLADENTDQEDWIEIYNGGGVAVNLLGWSLTDAADTPRKWVFPARTLNAGSYLVVFASGKDRKPAAGNLHTSFKLNENGGYLALSRPETNGTATSRFPFDYDPLGVTEFPPQRYDYSFGIVSGPANRYYSPPTPGSVNGASTLTAIAAKPAASVGRGFFKDPFTVVLSCATPGATIRYTLDGTVPTVSSLLYSTPISVNATTVLRTVAFATNYVPSETVTHSYIYLDSIFAQTSPPYDNPANGTDDANPDPPTVGGVGLPVHWGTFANFNNTPGTGNVPFNNLPAINSVPADYGMDAKVWNDPNLYNDAGAINAGGKTNLARMKSALREMPILSVVLKTDDMFGATGLYPLASDSDKTDRTKPCSLEMILPDGTTAFAATCGIDLHGNASRGPYKNPKHGFTLKFKGDYGGGKLEYPVFLDSPVESHDKLVLRADFNFSWRHQENTSQRPFGNRIRDAWSKDTFRAMGQPAGHHRYVNLFINGIYWGSYDLAEDEGDNFGADYFGGVKADYDVMEQGILKSGTSTAYNALTAIAAPIDNTKYEQVKTLLDVPEFIDYMLLHFFVGHTDWGDNINKNWYAVRNFRKNGPYRFLPWDMENLLAGEGDNRTAVPSPPGGLHPKLVGSAQYKLDFADRVHRHMISPDGALLPAANIARLNKWGAIMNAGQQALESARWGDYRRDVHRYTTAATLVYTWNGKWFEGGGTQTSTTNWLTEMTRLTNTYFPARTNNVMGQLRAAAVGLYPTVNAPEIRNNATNIAIASQRVSPGFVVKFANVTALPSGTTNAATFYYTTNGSDPRVYYTGAIAAGAIAVAPNAPLDINATTTLKVRAFNGATWSALNEQTFSVGPESLIPPVRITEIMYNPPGSTGDDAAEFIELRNAGTQPVDISNWFLGGVECIIPAGTVLGPGDHFVLASNESPAFFATTYPGVAVGAYFGGVLDNGGERITLYDATGRIIVSVDYEDDWVPLTDGDGYSMEIIAPDGDPDDPANWKTSAVLKGTPGTANSAPVTPQIIINEFLVMNAGAYNVDGFTPGYVELFNPGTSTVNIGGWGLVTSGPQYFFPPGTTMSGGSYLVVNFGAAGAPGHSTASPLADFEGTIYLVPSAGPFVRLSPVRYGPQAANHAFGRIAGAWVLTTPTPGAANTAAAVAPQGSLRINEWLANPVPGYDDWLELYNTHASLPAALSGLYVGTSSQLFQIKTLSAVGPASWVQLLCREGSSRPHTLDFDLPAAGTTLSIRDSAGTQADSLTFGAQAEGVSQGRLPDGTGPVVTLPFPSPALANYAALTGQPVINEVLATNLNGDNAPWGARPPWIELKNPGAGAVNLGGWKLRHPLMTGQTWTFPAGTTIAAGGLLALWTDHTHSPSTVSGPHMNFILNYGSPLANAIELVNPAGQVVDRIIWGWQITDLSIGRLANNSWALLATPTRGATNSAAASLGPVSALRINEWHASSVELFNTSALPVSLGGLFLSDDPGEIGRRKYQIPPLSFIPGAGFVTYATQGDIATAFETGFILSSTGEYLRLAQGDDTQLDAISFGAIPFGNTQGRTPDGSATIANLAALTSGYANIQGSGPWFIGGSGSQIVLAGSGVGLDVSFINATSYQWMKDGVPLAGGTTTSLALNPIFLSGDGIYTCVATGPGGSASSPPIQVTVLHTYDTWISSFGYPGAPPGGDLDHDGIQNLAEFIANTNPLQSATPAERAAHHAVGGVEFLAGVPANLTLDFRLNRRAAFSGLGAEVSPDLSTWTFATPTLTELLGIEPNGDEHWRMKYSIPGGATKHFIRLGITE